MTAQYGAHEVMEIHEVLCKCIDTINIFHMYSSHVQDQQLAEILNNQLSFMTNSYNQMINTLNQGGMGQAVPYRTPITSNPSYGLNNPTPQSPISSINELSDRDIASGMLGCHKASASMKMMAALECANIQLRKMLQQGAINCSEQAYEVWSYMNTKGFYQVPTMKEMTTNTMLGSYAPSQGIGNIGIPQGMMK